MNQTEKYIANTILTSDQSFTGLPRFASSAARSPALNGLGPPATPPPRGPRLGVLFGAPPLEVGGGGGARLPLETDMAGLAPGFGPTAGGFAPIFGGGALPIIHDLHQY